MKQNLRHGCTAWFACIFAILLSIQAVSAATKTASFIQHNRSITLGTAYASDGTQMYFSTYDGVHTWARYQSGYGRSGELRPDSITSGTYRSDYDRYWPAYSGFTGYGNISLTIPTTDSDGDGLPDFDDKSRGGSWNTSGSATEYYSGQGTGSYSLNGNFSRSAGSYSGNYSATSSSGVTVSGTFYVNGSTGNVTYDSSAGTLSISGSLFSGNNSFSGSTTYQIVNSSTIQVQGFQVSFSSGLPQTVNTFTLTRSGSRYYGHATFVDGTPETSWVDYKDFHISITDNNDTDGDGIPDLSDSSNGIAPSITTQPQSQTKPLGGSVTFSVTATGTAPLTYLWKKNGQNINSATSSQLTLSPLTAADAATYTVTVSNSYGNQTSSAASLTVATPPTISGQPTGGTYIVGVPLQLSVVATGTGLSYQWYKGINPLGGATASTLDLGNADLTESGEYQVVVSGPFASVASQTASVVVTTAILLPPSSQAEVLSINSEGFRINAQLQSGVVYRIEYSENLVQWMTLTTFTSSSTANQFLDIAAKNKPQRFYRLVKQ